MGFVLLVIVLMLMFMEHRKSESALIYKLDLSALPNAGNIADFCEVEEWGKTDK